MKRVVFFQKQNWDILAVCYRDYMLNLINDDDDDGDVIVQTFYFVFFIKMDDYYLI